MKSCIMCGTQIDDDHIFCFNCGARQIIDAEGTDNRQAGAVRDEVKYCISCNSVLSVDTVFCPLCGTKQYIREANREISGAPLLMLHSCRFYTLAGLFSSECRLEIYDNKLLCYGIAGEAKFFMIFPELIRIADFRSPSSEVGLKLFTRAGKSHCITFPPEMSEFVTYVKMLLADYSGAII